MKIREVQYHFKNIVNEIDMYETGNNNKKGQK